MTGIRFRQLVPLGVCLFMATACIGRRQMNPAAAAMPMPNAVTHACEPANIGSLAALETLAAQTDWRYTRLGWRQLDLGPVVRTHATRMTPTPPSMVHPLSMSIIILLTVLWLAAWASDEWDWARLVRDQI